MDKESIMIEYSKDNMKKLKQLAYSIFSKFGGIENYQYDDFYSIANIELWKAVEKYDATKCDNFNNYLKSNLERKYKTHIRDLNRDKRCKKYIDKDGQIIYEKEVRLDATVNGSEKDSLDLVGKVDSKLDSIMNENINEDLAKYLSRLNKKQKRMLIMIADGYKEKEIKELLGITADTYNAALTNIRSDRRTAPIRHLFSLV